MAKASLVSIGNELLNGHTTDTNATYICRQLLSIGVPVVSVYAVGDDISKIVMTLKRASADGDIVIATGGLGPTDDDLTRQAIAELLKTELILDERLLEIIRGFFKKRELAMPEKTGFRHSFPKELRRLKTRAGRRRGLWRKWVISYCLRCRGCPLK